MHTYKQKIPQHPIAAYLMGQIEIELTNELTQSQFVWTNLSPHNENINS